MIDAIIGRYRARVEETGLILTHPSGISFDLTAEEALALQDFVAAYRKTLLAPDCDTEPVIKRIVIKEPAQET